MGGGEIRSCMDLWNAAAGKGIRGWCPAGEAGEKTEKAKGGLAAARRQGPLHLLWDATRKTPREICGQAVPAHGKRGGLL